MQISYLLYQTESFENTDDVVSVADSKEGWARGFKDLISYLYTCRIPKINVSKVRPAGQRLKTFGGRASGPEPLDSLFKFVVATFSGAPGRKLNSIECHDIVCKIAEIVVVGGVRRSAFDLTIKICLMTECDTQKQDNGGSNTDNELQQTILHVTQKSQTLVFLWIEWKALYDSKSGERGIFNRESANKQAERNGRRRVEGQSFGTNPCSEIYSQRQRIL